MPPPSSRSRRLTVALLAAATLAAGLPAAKAALVEDTPAPPAGAAVGEAAAAPTGAPTAAPAKANGAVTDEATGEAPEAGGLASSLATAVAEAATPQQPPPPAGASGALTTTAGAAGGTKAPSPPPAPAPLPPAEADDEGDDDQGCPPEGCPVTPTPTPTTLGTGTGDDYGDDHGGANAGQLPPVAPPPAPPPAVPSPTPRPPEAGPDLVAGQFQDAQQVQPGQQTVNALLDVNIYDRGVDQTHAGRTVIVEVPAGQAATPVQELVVDGRTYALVDQRTYQNPGEVRHLQLQYDKELNAGEIVLKAVNDWWTDTAAPALANFWDNLWSDPCGAVGLCPRTTIPPIHGNPGAPQSATGSGDKPLQDIDWPEP